MEFGYILMNTLLHHTRPIHTTRRRLTGQTLLRDALAPYRLAAVGRIELAESRVNDALERLPARTEELTQSVAKELNMAHNGNEKSKKIACVPGVPTASIFLSDVRPEATHDSCYV